MRTASVEKDPETGFAFVWFEDEERVFLTRACEVHLVGRDELRNGDEVHVGSDEILTISLEPWYPRPFIHFP